LSTSGQTRQTGLKKQGVAAHLSLLLPSFVAVAVLGTLSPSAARDYKVSGGITTGYEFYDRQYEKEEVSEKASDETGESTTTTATTTAATATTQKDDSYNRLRVAPLIIVNSSSARDELSFRYSPGFYYDTETSDHDIDHNLNAAYKYSLTRHWQLKLTERYLLTDKNIVDSNETESSTTTESQTTAENAEPLADNNGRRRYWTNDLGFVSEHTYLEDSLFSFGYTFGVLENIDTAPESTYENYDRHSAQVSLGHRFDSIWKLTASGNYVRGLYDTPAEEEETDSEDASTNKDLSEYRALTSLESRLIEHNPLSLAYSFAAIDYDADDQATVALHDVTGGWQWEISKEFTVNLGAGPSFQKTEGQSGNWGYNANAKVRYALERGALELSANRGYAIENFTGTDENGLREFWQSRLGFDYTILENLSFKLFTTYRNEDREEITERRLAQTEVQTEAQTEPQTQTQSDTSTVTEAEAATETPPEEQEIITETAVFNRQQYGAGTSLGYKFGQWYSMNLSYNYLQQDSEQVDDSYDEHRLILSLSVEKDLLNW